MSLYQLYDMAYCDRCHGQRPHSKRGRCLASHRGTPLATVTPLKRAEFTKGGYAAGNKTVSELAPPPPALRSEKEPPRRYDQAQVRAAISSLLAGLSTLQQASRDVGCDTEYLHKKAWAAAKQATLIRDGRACVYPDNNPFNCHGGLDTQHRMGRGSGGSSNPLVVYYLPNLITLCRHHHQLVTTDPAHGMALGLVIPRGGIVHDPAHVPATTIHGLVLLEGAGRRVITPPDGSAA